MKKLLCMIFAAALLLSSVACSKEAPEEPGKDTAVQTAAENESTKAVEDTQKTAPENDEKVDPWEFICHEIYVDCDKSFRRFNRGLAFTALKERSALLSICSDQEPGYEGTLEEVPEYFLPKFVYYCQRDTLWNSTGSDPVVLTKENVTVAGFDSVKFTAKAENLDCDDSTLYGYAFIINGIPCLVLDFITATHTDPALVEEYNALVDAMAQTIRTEK